MTLYSSIPSVVPMVYTMALLLSFILAAPAAARELVSPTGRQIPILDANAPRHTETASFGLG